MTIFYKSIYNDGTSFVFSEDDVGKGDYSKIDRKKLIYEEIYDDTKLLHRLHLEAGQRLILRKKVVIPNFITFNPLIQDMDLNPEIKKLNGEIPKSMMIPIILVGYQQTIRGENTQAITAIFPDGHTEHISKWKEVPFDAINLRQEEKEEILNA